MRMARTLCLALAIGAGGVLPAFGQPPRLKVLTSFLPAYCFTVNLTGPLDDVGSLLPTGVGPHDYQLSPQDLRRLEAADLIVVNGLRLESWLDKALQTGAIRDPSRVVRAATGLESQWIESGSPTPEREAVPGTRGPAGLGVDGPRGAPNAHLWLDPRLAAHAVTNILRALQRVDPANASAYARRAAAYLRRLDQLDAELRGATFPLHDRACITYHNAFPYFSRRYGLKVVGVIEAIPDVDPTPRYLAHLSETARQQHVRAIFTEWQASAPLAAQLARDLGVPLGELDTLETGPLVPTAYEDGMRRNLATLVKYLQ